MDIKKLLLTFILIIIAGCSQNNNPQKDTSVTTSDVRGIILETKNIKSNNINNKVIVYRYVLKPNIEKLKPDIIINGPITGEYVLVEIMGKIKSFEHISVHWDDNVLLEKGILDKYTNIENKLILLNTYFAEGPPINKIRIIDLNNKKYEYEFCESGLD